MIIYVHSRQQTYLHFHVIKHSLGGLRFRHTANKGLGHWGPALDTFSPDTDFTCEHLSW